jgi:hypothetical protein
MTLFEPTIRLNRLKIKQGGHTAYEAAFHSGVNIVHGRNSSGKTTILDFIAYALGAENIEWKPQALLCDEVYAEVALNRVPVTLKRSVNDSKQNPLSIYWGTLNEAESSGIGGWQIYPFRRSQTKDSFSQVIFRALGMPEVGVADANLTLHQLLRLLYVDQRSPKNSILRAEQFDLALTKETLERYVFGLYDDRLYEAQLRMRALDTELSQVVSQIGALFSVLHRAGQQTDFELITNRIHSLQTEQDSLSELLRELNETRTPAREGKDPGVADLRRKLSAVKASLSRTEDERQELELDVQDSADFVGELIRRVRSLDESNAAREYLGKATFGFCPCCLSKVEVGLEKEGDAACHLCKTSLGTREANSQLLRMRNELQIQREESDRLLAGKKARLDELNSEIPALRSELRGLEREYGRQSTTWVTENEAKIQETARRLGEIEQQVRQLVEYQKMGAILAELTRKRESLAAESEQLRTVIENFESAEEKRKLDAFNVVAEELIRLLRADLPLVEEFQNAQAVTWSFVENRVAVNGVENFSESSTVVLRHSFHLAVLIASTKRDYFRIPRFMLLDGVEDGGIEPERSFHFQNLIVDTLAGIEVDHQLIYATSGIADNLKRDDLVVGRAFTPERKSLDVSDPGAGFLPLS